MAIEKLKEEILRDAEIEAEGIIKPAKKQALSITNDAEKKAETLKKDGLSVHKQIIEVQKTKEMSKITQDKRKQLVRARHKLVNSIFDDALISLQSVDEKRRSTLLLSLLKKAEAQIQVGFVHLRKEDANLIKKYPVEISQISGGLIAETKDRSVVIDLSFDSLFSSLKDKEFSKVEKIVFGEK